MTVTSIELATARELLNSLLEALGLDAYLFEVEPKNAHWELKVECANEMDGSWTSASLQIANQLITDAAEDAGQRELLRLFLERELSSCKRSS